jgi:Tol biopolymer transport system component
LLGSSDDIVALKVDGPHTVRPIVSSPFVERMPVLSRNGRWLAYVSNETGRAEVYVQAFPTSAGKFVVSTEGGTQPVWSRDGTKLYYLASGTKDSLAVVRMIEVDVVTDGAFAARSRRQLFELDASHYGGAAQAHSYDVTPDGRRFVFVREVFPAGAAPRQIQMVGRWLDDQKRAVDPQSR